MTLAFNLLFCLYIFTTTVLLISRWYWKHMYLEFIKELEIIVDTAIGPEE